MSREIQFVPMFSSVESLQPIEAVVCLLARHSERLRARIEQFGKGPKEKKPNDAVPWTADQGSRVREKSNVFGGPTSELHVLACAPVHF